MIAFVAWALLTVAAAAAAASEDEFRLTILHTNDLHSHYDEACGVDAASPDGHGGCFGGFARLRAALDAERARATADGAPAVHLFAGDLFHGTPYYDAFHWEAAADFLGDLGVDVMCLGNHEFNDGPNGLAPFLRSKNISSIPVVVANINIEKEPSLTNIRPSVTLLIGGRSVGVVGYLTPDTEFTNNVGEVKIADEIQSVKTEVIRLKKSGVEFVIALGHSGLDMDRRVAREVDGVDVVVGGHSHSYLCSGPPQDTETPVAPYPVIEKRADQIVPVVQAYAFTKYLGKLVLTFDNKKRLRNIVGEPILLDQTKSQDVKMLEKVKYYKQLLTKYQTKEVIGKSTVFLNGSSKCTESNLGNSITDSFIHYNIKNLLNQNNNLTGWTDAAIAITSSGSIGGSINASMTQGKIYKDAIARILPYNTPLYKVTISGETLLKALEHSASTHVFKNCASPEHNIYGGFMQMSGIRITYDMTKMVGSRIQSAQVRCSLCNQPSFEPIDPNKRYSVITTKYIVNGGDQYKMIKEGTIEIVDMNVTETEAYINYVRERGIIYPEVENRIKILNSNQIL